MRTIINSPLVAIFATILSTSLLLGCKTETKSAAGDQAKKDAHDDHDHDHDHALHGPHGGELIAFDGHKYHTEIVINPKEGKVTLYMLDGSAEQSLSVANQEPVLELPIDGESKEFTFVSVPQADDDEGVTSRFELVDETLATALRGAAAAKSTFSVEINGKRRTGKYEGCGHHHHGLEDDGSHDILVWRQKDIELAGHMLQLGHHGMVIHAGEKVEPAAIVSRDGETIGEAKVFATLVADDGETVLVEETAMVFEPKTEEEPAHHAGGHLEVPAEVEQVVIRYRIELPDGAGEETYDVRVNTESDE